MSAEQYREELIRDSFINGLNSQGIRLRRLEKDDLSLEAAYEQAYSVERAQKQSSVYSQPITASVAKPPQDRDAFEQHTAVPTSEDALTKDESAVAAVQKKKNAFSVEALIISDAVVLLGMLSVMNAEKLDTSLRFANLHLILHFGLESSRLMKHFPDVDL